MWKNFSHTNLDEDLTINIKYVIIWSSILNFYTLSGLVQLSNWLNLVWYFKTGVFKFPIRRT